MPERNVRTVGEVIKSGAGFLAGKGVDSPRLCCELLLARLLNCRPLKLNLHANTGLSEQQIQAMRRGIRRLAAGEPVQYILGRTEFMGHVFKVDRRALIPRPETETLVEKVLQLDDLWKRDKPGIVDVGTGTGCVIISIALARPNGSYLGLDTSADAVALAEENAAALHVNDRILFRSAELSDVVDPERADAIVSNPPYVSSSDFDRLPVNVRDFEPRCALDGGPDGLRIIEAVVQDAAMALKNGGYLFLEIGETQAGPVTRFMRETGFADLSVHRDLAGKDRVAQGRLTG